MQMVSLSSISCKHVARYIYLALHCTKIAQISLTLFLVDVRRERFECTVIGSIEGSQPVSIISNQIIAVLRTHNFSVPGTEISSGITHQSMYVHAFMQCPIIQPASTLSILLSLLMASRTKFSDFKMLGLACTFFF